MEKTSQELLRSVHKNAEMGKISIPQVLEAAEDPGLRHALHHQLREYEVIAHQSEELLERRGAPPLPVCYAMAQQAAFSREGVTAEECDRLRHQVTDYAEAFQTSLSRTQRFILRWLWALV